MDTISALKRRLPAVRAWLLGSSVDAIVAVLVGLAVYRLLLPNLDPSLDSLRGKVYFWGDEGSVLYHAERIRQGEVLYRDFFDFQGLLGFLPFTAGFAVAPATPRTGRIVMFLLMALWGAVIYLTVHEVTRKRWAGVVAAIYFPLCVFPTWPYAYQHFIADLWITCAILFAIWAERGAVRRGWLVAGVFTGIALFTSLSEGGPALAALFGCCVSMRYARRDRWALVGQFLAGTAAVTSILVVYFLANGCLSEAFHAIFVVPFGGYRGSNKTEYGFDGARYVAYWSARGAPQGEVAELLVDMTMKVPKYGVIVALGVAALLFDRVLFRRYTRRVRRGSIPWSTLAPCVLAASAGSLAVPVWAEITRSDLCHIGFVQPMSVLALTALLAPISRANLKRLRWRAVLALQALAGAVVVVWVLYPVARFTLENERAAKKENLDEVIARDARCRMIDARTRPDDEIVVNYRSFTYLTCHRRSGMAFPHLAHGPYWVDQWPKAAAEIARRKPRILFLTRGDFETLAGYAPELRELYVGDNGDYMLAEARPGPPFGPSTWSYSIYGPGGNVTRGEVRFEKGTGPTPYVALFDDDEGAFTYVDDGKVEVFSGPRTFVLELDANGRAMHGQVFEGQGERHVDADIDAAP